MMGDRIEVPADTVKRIVELKGRIRDRLDKGADMGKMGSLDGNLSLLLSELDRLEEILERYWKEKEAATSK